MTPRGRGVAVVGSANLDVVVAVDRFPGPGETVLGGEVTELAGGKGLNQAIAVARIAPSALIGCVGNDEAGSLLAGRLDLAHVEATHLRRGVGATGRAFIQVAANGENSIVVAAGANLELTAEEVSEALVKLGPVLVLAQLEVPLAAVEAAAAWAGARGVRFVLNPSPVRPLPLELLSACDPLVLNATEAAQLAGSGHGTPPGDLARALTAVAASVVVTDGPRGAHVASSGTVQHVPGRPARAVDTTGAGDEFTGRLAASLAQGENLATAAEAANLAASAVVALPRSKR